MENRKQFTMYESIFKSLQRIRNKKDRADAYDAICAYALYNEKPDLESVSDAVAIAFELTRPVLDSARKKSENGKQGGSKTKANGKQTASKAKQTETEKEVEIEKEIEKESLYSAMCASDSLFDSFWEAYPKQVDKPAALSAWTDLAMSEREKKELLLHLDDWKKSEQWAEAGGRFVPKPSNFLDRNQIYLCTIPKPAKQPIPKGASGVLGEAELEAIQRVLSEG